MNAATAIQEAVADLLQRVESGPATVDDLVPLVYDELRAIAHRQLRTERRDHTLGTTALVNEAYLKLAGHIRIPNSSRAYFFAAVARAMREILVDYARQRNRVKRGGGIAPDTLTDNLADVDVLVDHIIDIDEALTRLEALNPRHARVVECRFFSGLGVEETALALGVSPRTVKQDWALARAWLFRALGE